MNEKKLKTIIASIKFCSRTNDATKQSLTMEYIEEGAIDFGISTDEMLDLMLEDLNQNKDE